MNPLGMPGVGQTMGSEERQVLAMTAADRMTRIATAAAVLAAMPLALAWTSGGRTGGHIAQGGRQSHSRCRMLPGIKRGATLTARRIPAGRIPNTDQLTAVSATSPANAWAVGWVMSAYSDNDRSTLIEHWNGKRWRVVPSPNPATGLDCFNNLAAVAATSRSNAWAVGGFTKAPNIGSLFAGYALIEHWNGKRWTHVPCPSPLDASLSGVAATSRSDAWAVGSDGPGTLIEHWNGKKWAVVPSPGGLADALDAVAAISPADAWAVGYSDLVTRALIEHWNGKKWTVVPSPHPGTTGNALNAVTATSATDVWAAGYYDNGKTRHTLMEHWNGKKWLWVPSPPVSRTGQHDEFFGISATVHDIIWTVGRHESRWTMIERWNGKTWIWVSSLNPAHRPSGLAGINAISGRDAWAVGDMRTRYGADLTLIERWNGRHWRHVPSPSP